jgi:hypothetical protein
LILENLALRQQLTIQQQTVKRPKLKNKDNRPHHLAAKGLRSSSVQPLIFLKARLTSKTYIESVYIFLDFCKTLLIWRLRSGNFFRIGR